MKTLIAALAVVTVFGAAPAFAANARHPHQNVDRRVDRGGDTGDSRVEQLNQQQLDMARAQNAPPTGPAMGAPAMGMPMSR